MYEHDNRIVMTLDAGGTNFVFSAIQGFREIVDPIRIDAVTDDTGRCLDTLVDGFRQIKSKLKKAPAAISFAFPGPADYENGIIGDLPNFPCFRGGVAMGPFLAEKFGLPVFINNDGNLFAYGEAIAGVLPQLNASLRAAGSSKIYKNLLGITLGTGFGAGAVIDGRLLRGDNGCGGDVWLMRNSSNPKLISEESVSIRAIKRMYRENAPDDRRDLEPKDIFEIAEGVKDGNRQAAMAAFARSGQVAAGAIASALDIVDGIVVIGGGLSGAAKYIIPAMVKELNSTVEMLSGECFPCLQMKVLDLTSEEGMEEFLTDNSAMVKVHGTDREARYCKDKKTGVTVSGLGAGTAISFGAYAFALRQIDNL